MVDTAQDVRIGEVIAVSPFGFRLDGEDRWYNLSKAVEGLELPEKGDYVELSLDGKGYVTAIAVIDGEVTAAPLGEPEAGDEAAVAVRPKLPSKDLRSQRMSLLAMATTILSSGGRAIEPERVLPLATELEDWVNR